MLTCMCFVERATHQACTSGVHIGPWSCVTGSTPDNGLNGYFVLLLFSECKKGSVLFVKAFAPSCTNI